MRQPSNIPLDRGPAARHRNRYRTLSLYLTGKVKTVTRKVVIIMWIDIVMPILFALAIYGFISWTGLQKRFLTRRTDRTAESMYDKYARGDRPPRS